MLLQINLVYIILCLLCVLKLLFSLTKIRCWLFHCLTLCCVHHYLCHHLVRGEGILSLGVRLSRCVCVRRISLGGEGNMLYPVLSSLVL